MRISDWSSDVCSSDLAIPRKLTFTGSTATGRKVMASGANDLKRVTLELGGNDPAVILDDADISAIADELFWGAFANNGQVCVAIKRIYEIGRASCRERVCQYVYISVVAVSLKKKKQSSSTLV